MTVFGVARCSLEGDPAPGVGQPTRSGQLLERRSAQTGFLSKVPEPDPSGKGIGQVAGRLRDSVFPVYKSRLSGPSSRTSHDSEVLGARSQVSSLSCLALRLRWSGLRSFDLSGRAGRSWWHAISVDPGRERDKEPEAETPRNRPRPPG